MHERAWKDNEPFSTPEQSAAPGLFKAEGGGETCSERPIYRDAVCRRLTCFPSVVQGPHDVCGLL